MEIKIMLFYFVGIWKSVPLKGDAPPKCSNFSFTKLQEDVVVMFGGYLGNDQYSNELYTLDLINMVRL